MRKTHNDILAKENDMTPSRSIPRFQSHWSSYWPLVVTFILSLLAWGAVLFNNGARRDSIYVLAVILLLGILAVIWPLISVWRASQREIFDLSSPFSGEPEELINEMLGSGPTVKMKSGTYEISEGDRITTNRSFQTPVAFRIVAKTNSTNIRFSYAEKEIIFNWEDAFDVLRIDGGPLGVQTIPGFGQLPINRWVTIDLIYRADRFSVHINGGDRFSRSADFSSYNRPLSVFSGAIATINVKSILAGIPA
jgi:hypothetical protein